MKPLRWLVRSMEKMLKYIKIQMFLTLGFQGLLFVNTSDLTLLIILELYRSNKMITTTKIDVYHRLCSADNPLAFLSVVEVLMVFEIQHIYLCYYLLQMFLNLSH